MIIDPWCVTNVRKVKRCEDCLHFDECSEIGKSVSPKANARETDGNDGTGTERIPEKRD